MQQWGEDDEWDEEEDEDDDQDVTEPCPHCGRPVYDDAERCPWCGSYLSREDEPYRRPWWMLVGVGTGLYAVYRWVVGG
jgi:hypothetical protein